MRVFMRLLIRRRHAHAARAAGCSRRNGAKAVVAINLWLRAAAAAAQAKFDDNFQDAVRWGGRSLLLLLLLFLLLLFLLLLLLLPLLLLLLLFLLLLLLLLGRNSRLMRVIRPKYDERACGTIPGHIKRIIFRGGGVQQDVT
jgi:Flp pilus assembly protein TadB